MRVKALLLVCFIYCLPILAGTMDISVSISRMPDARLESKCYVLYDGTTFDFWTGKEKPVLFSVHQAIIQVGYSSIADADERGFSPYSNSLTSPSPGTAPNCYRGRATATPDDTGTSKTESSEDLCFAPPQQPPNDPINQCEDTSQAGCWSPIVLDLSGGAYELSGPDDPVAFDITATGSPVRLSWTARNAAMTFLALDLNGDGVINSGAELFGNHTALHSQLASNGFDALAQYDANRDGEIDANDAIWNYLLLWTDRNHDGLSQSGEIMPVRDSVVLAISLDYHWTGRRDVSGNTFRFQSRARWANGHHGEYRPIYDIFFVPAP